MVWWCLLSAFAQELDEPETMAGGAGMYLGQTWNLDPETQADSRGITSLHLAANLHSFDGDRFSGALNLGLGRGLDRGFFGEADLRIGPGAWITDRFAFAVRTGPSLSGLHNRMPWAFRWAVETTTTIDLLPKLRLEAWARGDFIAGPNHPRQDGAASFGIPDELALGGRLLPGSRTAADVEEPDSHVMLGFEYQERMGGRVLLFQLGLAFSQEPWRANDDFDPALLEEMLRAMTGELPGETDGAALDGALDGSTGTIEVPPPLDGKPSADAQGAALCAGLPALIDGAPSGFPGRVGDARPADAEGKPDGSAVLQPISAMLDQKFAANASDRLGYIAVLYDGGSREDAAATWEIVGEAVAQCRLPGLWVRDHGTLAPDAVLAEDVHQPFSSEGDRLFGWKLVNRFVQVGDGYRVTFAIVPPG